MLGNPKIVTVGNRHEHPREWWGDADWRAEIREQARRISQPLAPLAPPASTLALPLYGKPESRRERHARILDARLAALGIEPRPSSRPAKPRPRRRVEPAAERSELVRRASGFVLGIR
jgi:hypothetical protein